MIHSHLQSRSVFQRLWTALRQLATMAKLHLNYHSSRGQLKNRNNRRHSGMGHSLKNLNVKSTCSEKRIFCRCVNWEKRELRFTLMSSILYLPNWRQILREMPIKKNAHSLKGAEATSLFFPPWFIKYHNFYYGSGNQQQNREKLIGQNPFWFYCLCVFF